MTLDRRRAFDPGSRSVTRNRLRERISKGGALKESARE